VAYGIRLTAHGIAPAAIGRSGQPFSICQEDLLSKAKNGKPPDGEQVVDYRHKKVKRLNIPPAGLAARGEMG
jgi:hypothetical protein